jgi:hypothetical protein
MTKKLQLNTQLLEYGIVASHLYNIQSIFNQAMYYGIVASHYKQRLFNSQLLLYMIIRYH